jgi:hypothetical protein
MRILLSKSSREKLFQYIFEENDSSSMKDLSIKLKQPLKTLQEWRYNYQRYIPYEFIPQKIETQLEILDKQENNWGKIKGGKITQKILLVKYGPQEIKNRQKNGGKRSAEEKIKNDKPLNIKLDDPLFLEFYGILLGDGWLSKLHSKNKTIHLIGISGHLVKDKGFHHKINNNIKKLFDRNPYLKEIKRYNAREILFSHKVLFNFLVEKLNFPIGLKKNLHLPTPICQMDFNLTKYIIRGIFDTDGCFYLDKTPVGKPYPCISITMKEPALMQQIYNCLISQGFKVYHYKSEKIEMLILKGSKKLKKWLNEIGSSNPSKSNIMQKALVAQFG